MLIFVICSKQTVYDFWLPTYYKLFRHNSIKVLQQNWLIGTMNHFFFDARNIIIILTPTYFNIIYK